MVNFTNTEEEISLFSYYDNGIWEKGWIIKSSSAVTHGVRKWCLTSVEGLIFHCTLVKWESNAEILFTYSVSIVVSLERWRCIMHNSLWPIRAMLFFWCMYVMIQVMLADWLFSRWLHISWFYFFIPLRYSPNIYIQNESAVTCSNQGSSLWSPPGFPFLFQAAFSTSPLLCMQFWNWQQLIYSYLQYSVMFLRILFVKFPRDLEETN